MHKLSDTQSILMYHSVVKVKKIIGLSVSSKFNLQYGMLGKYKLVPMQYLGLVVAVSSIVGLLFLYT